MSKHAVNNILNRVAANRKTTTAGTNTKRSNVVANTTGFDPIGSDLCRVRVELHGTANMDGKQLRQAVSAALGEGVEPVIGTFQQLPEVAGVATREFVGLVTKGMCTRIMDVASVRAKYSEVTTAKNVLMDNTDNTVWNMTPSGSGQVVLSRQVDEDLSDLLALARVANNKNRNYKDALVVMANTAAYSRFYNPVTKSTDHGYICGREANGEVVIASRTLNDLVNVDDRMIITCTNLHADDTEYRIHASLYKGGVKCPSHLIQAMKAQRQKQNVFQTVALVTDTETTLDPESVSYTDMRDYYKQMYAYAPEYYNEFEKMISDHGF